MRKNNNEGKKFEQAWAYLDKKFVGVSNYAIIGFLETFKQDILNEINEDLENKE